MDYDLQKADMWKRIGAFLLDAILTTIIAVGFAYLISLISGLQKNIAEYKTIVSTYEKEYEIDLSISQSEYKNLSPEKQTAYEQAEIAWSKDEHLAKVYSLVLSLSMMTVSISLLLGFLMCDFVIPLIFKNGQTVGKKVFSIGVMHENGVKLTTFALFVRTVLAKYVLETMIPACCLIMIFVVHVNQIFALILLLAILIMQIVFLIKTSTNSVLHDLMARTVTVDMASQRIFKNEEELIAYKARIAEELALREKEGA